MLEGAPIKLTFGCSSDIDVGPTLPINFAPNLEDFTLHKTFACILKGGLPK